MIVCIICTVSTIITNSLWTHLNLIVFQLCVNYCIWIFCYGSFAMTLVAGLEARRFKDKKHLELFHVQLNDVSMLRLFGAFLHSAPQFAVQLYIVTCTNKAHVLTRKFKQYIGLSIS